MNYYKELIKRYHPDVNNNSKYSNSICRVINELKNKPEQLRNLYERLV